MKKEINLEEIANTSGVFRSLMDRQMQDVTLTLMKEACNQCLDLAAENATTTRISYFDGTDLQQLNCVDIWEEDSSVPCYLAIPDKYSILQIKDWIK